MIPCEFCHFFLLKNIWSIPHIVAAPMRPQQRPNIYTIDGIFPRNAASSPVWTRQYIDEMPATGQDISAI